MPKTASVSHFFKSERSAEALYEVSHRIGKGSYGTVVAGRNRSTGEKVAIKHIDRVFADKADTVRIIRELRFLRLLRHPNIVAVSEVLIPQREKTFDDIFIVTELLDTDLAHLIKSKTKYDDIHTRWLLFQLLRGLKHIHAASVYHRDLKPGNLLLNANCDLKICDFGLARAHFADEAADTPVFWTDYVATRWYRAPELICSYFTRYSAAVDIWAAGCIFGELLKRKALFPGANVYHQIDLITDFVGTPGEHTISKVRNHKARDYLGSLPAKPRGDWAASFPGLDASGVDLLSKLLAFDPDERISAESALDHPYFAAFHNTLDESIIPPPPLMLQEEFAWENEKRLTVKDLRATLFGEILIYHPQAPRPAAAAAGAGAGAGQQSADAAARPVRAPSQYGEHGTACDDVRSQMQQLERGDRPSSRAASMPSAATQALVSQAAAATRGTPASPPAVGVCPGEEGQVGDAFAVYEQLSEDMALDAGDADSAGLEEQDENRFVERKAESLSADNVMKMAAAATPLQTRERPHTARDAHGLRDVANQTRRPSSATSSYELKKLRQAPPPAPPPPPPPPPAAPLRAAKRDPSVNLRSKLSTMRTEAGVGAAAGHEEGCAIM